MTTKICPDCNQIHHGNVGSDLRLCQRCGKALKELEQTQSDASSPASSDNADGKQLKLF